MDIKKWGGIAAIGGVAVIWGHIKQFLNSLRNLVVVTHRIEHWGYTESLMRWLSKNISYFNCGAKAYVIKLMNGNARVRMPIGAWNRVYGTHLAFYKKRVPLIITVAPSNDDVRITYIKGTFPVTTMIQELVDDQNIMAQHACDIRWRNEWLGTGFWTDHVWGSLVNPTTRLSGATAESTAQLKEGEMPVAGNSSDSGKMVDLLTRRALKQRLFVPIAGDTAAVTNASSESETHELKRNWWLRRMYLTPEQRGVIDEIKFWMQSHAWYEERGITWRRSLFLHGPPGTGKSSLAYAMAVALELPIRTFHMDTMTDRDFVTNWRSPLSGAVIHLLEDFDTVFDGRRNNFRNDINNALSFECLLNVLDGVEVSDGIITIVTTNQPDNIDEALLRPGRLDTQIAFDKLGLDGKLHIGKTILSHMSKAKLTEFFERVLPEPATGAVIQETCIKEALRQYWVGFSKTKRS